MARERILVVEDDQSLLRGLKDNLAYEGYDVSTADDGEKGLSAALDTHPDLIVLDIMLPKMNGYEICRLLREEGLDMPIIMLTAKSQEPDVILGLDLGADDYVTKPFRVGELMARVKALLRRRHDPEGVACRFGDCEIDLTAHVVRRNDQEIALTPKEFAVLALLAKRPGRVFTRDEILRRVWGYSVFVTSRSVDRCINTLRSKIESDPARPVFIKTVRAVGYRFEMPES
jgi:DNA-binding response OmpR family regulator